MQQIFKKVLWTTSMTMCLSAVTMVPIVTQAHDTIQAHKHDTTKVVAEPWNICELQSVRGPCKGYIPRYYYDVDARACNTFIYGGCEGNQNNFQTSAECEAECKTSPTVAAAPRVSEPDERKLRADCPSFEYQIVSSCECLLPKVDALLQEYGGDLEGDCNKGTGYITEPVRIVGDYQIRSQVLTITITERPWYLGCYIIIPEIRRILSENDNCN